ncbi:hypothetical protein EVG20_g11518 [Dentipellis fragilis]|uniref:Uncharacterized protein n=1 Tax=Dentipellis fragilis TaxID=205917 RepID=A0A4Y9XPJ6_9AGAM|nr:hypothetical protein EVG20_g11518 [Dentipellis fragilis]
MWARVIADARCGPCVGTLDARALTQCASSFLFLPTSHLPPFTLFSSPLLSSGHTVTAPRAVVPGSMQTVLRGVVRALASSVPATPRFTYAHPPRLPVCALAPFPHLCHPRTCPRACALDAGTMRSALVPSH